MEPAERFIIDGRPGEAAPGIKRYDVDAVASKEKRGGYASVSYTHLTLPTNREV